MGLWYQSALLACALLVSPIVCAFGSALSACAFRILGGDLTAAQREEMAHFRTLLTDPLEPREAQILNELARAFLSDIRGIPSQYDLNHLVDASTYRGEASAISNLTAPYRAAYGSKAEAPPTPWRALHQTLWRPVGAPLPVLTYAELLERMSSFMRHATDRPMDNFMPSTFILDMAQPVFAFLPSLSEHLGFRYFNDRGPFPLAHIGFSDRTLEVDGKLFPPPDFSAHDRTHADFNLMVWRWNLEKVNEELKNLLPARRKSLLPLLRLIENNLAVYRAFRSYADGLVGTNRREALLAELIWFFLDHEANLAYSLTSYPYLDQDTGQADYIQQADGQRFISRGRLISILYGRARDRGDLGQAFRDPSWITAEAIAVHLDNITPIVGW